MHALGCRTGLPPWPLPACTAFLFHPSVCLTGLLHDTTTQIQRPYALSRSFAVRHHHTAPSTYRAVRALPRLFCLRGGGITVSRARHPTLSSSNPWNGGLRWTSDLHTTSSASRGFSAIDHLLCVLLTHLPQRLSSVSAARSPPGCQDLSVFTWADSASGELFYSGRLFLYSVVLWAGYHHLYTLPFPPGTQTHHLCVPVLRTNYKLASPATTSANNS